MVIYVTKADGTKQPFDRRKIVKTCLKLGASNRIANIVANEVEKKVYDGIPTKKLLRLVYTQLSNYMPEIRRFMDLREALSLLPPKPGFEIFVQRLFQEMGYKTEHGRIVEGLCSEHEIDVIAKKDDKIYLIEVKHHISFHTMIGMDVLLQLNSTLQDLREAYYKEKNRIYFDKAILVSNSKFSAHAKKYAKCRGIDIMGWNSPEGRGIEYYIEKFKVKPITILKGLNEKEIEKLSEVGIVTIKDLVYSDFKFLRRLLGRSEKSVKNMVNNAKLLLER